MVRRIEGTEAIEVYVSEKGYVCIKQDSGPLVEEDSIICMLPVHVPLVVKWLQEAAAQVEEAETVGIVESDGEGR